MSVCMICGQRRIPKGERFCHVCKAQMASDSKRRAPAQPVKFLTYRGHVVGLYPNGGGTLRGRLLSRNPAKLPKGKTIDLNRWCEGYTRQTIKGFKAQVLKLAAA